LLLSVLHAKGWMRVNQRCVLVILQKYPPVFCKSQLSATHSK